MAGTLSKSTACVTNGLLCRVVSRQEGDGTFFGGKPLSILEIRLKKKASGHSVVTKLINIVETHIIELVTAMLKPKNDSVAFVSHKCGEELAGHTFIGRTPPNVDIGTQTFLSKVPHAILGRLQKRRKEII